MVKTMTTAAEQDYRRCEKTLRDHASKFVAVGEALAEIRDGGLFRTKEAGKHDSFKAWLAEQTGWLSYSERHALDLMKAAKLAPSLPTAEIPRSDWNASNTLPLARIQSDARAAKVAKKVIKTAKDLGKKVTAKLVTEHVNQELGVKPKRKPKPKKPELHEYLDEQAAKLTGFARLLDGIPADGLRIYSRDHSQSAKRLVKAVEQLQKSLTRVWERLP